MYWLTDIAIDDSFMCYILRKKIRIPFARVLKQKKKTNIPETAREAEADIVSKQNANASIWQPPPVRTCQTVRLCPIYGYRTVAHSPPCLSCYCFFFRYSPTLL